MTRLYFDHNATTPLRPAAREAMLVALDSGGNASSSHQDGRAARGRIEAARRDVAQVTGAAVADIVLTSGATEALNTLLQPTERHRHLMVSATEHSAVLDGHRFAPDCVTLLPVEANGLVSPSALEQCLGSLSASEAAATLVAIQLANNETGVIQPVVALAAIAHRFGAAFVCDAVQAAGRLDLKPVIAAVDALVISSHKAGGPMGAGAIAFSPSAIGFQPLIRGGGQERRRRAGTENVAAIAGFASALKEAEALRLVEMDRISMMRDRFEATLKIARPDTIYAGEAAPRLANTSLVIIPGISAETAVIAFDLEGVSLSAGAACSSGKVAASHVLQAMGFSHDLAKAGLRISFGWTSSEVDAEKLAALFPKLVERLVKSKRERAA